MTRKKRAAWGSLTQIDSTTWRLRFWASGPDGYRRRSKTIRGTRLDAERAGMSVTPEGDPPADGEPPAFGDGLISV
jgi:hypothetical protein